MNKKIGIMIDNDFATKHIPPYPHPMFFSYENPRRIEAILQYFDRIKFFDNNNILKLTPKLIDESILRLAHSQYYIDTIKRLSKFGSGILSEEVYITQDTFLMAEKAVGGVIASLESILNHQVSQSFALVRPPGHHALREQSSGLCIFNNIATSIYYLRERLNYNEKIAIIDIDNHFGDGLARYFYEDPNVLYFSVHEFDFLEGDIGFITELGAGEGLGTNINFPIPMNTSDQNFMEFSEILTPILTQFSPDFIIIAAGFDMYFADPIGNCLLTSKSYYDFTHYILNLSQKLCDGKLVFALEGGYSLIGLPLCVHSVLRALLKESFTQPQFEQFDFSEKSENRQILKIKKSLKKVLKPYWELI
jgi:acetoin utilization deacetylase AcuC-like enzyme